MPKLIWEKKLQAAVKRENVPTLSMPIINEGDPMPEPSIRSLPIIIEKKRIEFNGSEEKKY